MTKPIQSVDNSGLVRLNKFISSSGFAARRKADELILAGRVSVNSKTVTELGVKIDPEKDAVKVDGEPLKAPARFLYILLNKPKGYITTTSDDLHRPTVMDLVKIKQRVYPVGRLDYDTEGLLLLTSDGDLSAKLMHPSSKVLKTYLVKLSMAIDEARVEKLRSGIRIDGKMTGKADIKIVPESYGREILITIHEGRNRQIRKMIEAVGLYVRKLKRIEYAGLKLDKVKSGDWRYLNAAEVAGLKKLVGK